MDKCCIEYRHSLIQEINGVFKTRGISQPIKVTRENQSDTITNISIVISSLQSDLKEAQKAVVEASSIITKMNEQRDKYCTCPDCVQMSGFHECYSQVIQKAKDADKQRGEG